MKTHAHIISLSLIMMLHLAGCTDREGDDSRAPDAERVIDQETSDQEMFNQSLQDAMTDLDLNLPDHEITDLEGPEDRVPDMNRPDLALPDMELPDPELLDMELLDVEPPDMEVTPSCDDLEHNGAETDVDCGGDCAPCHAGLDCLRGSDCEHSVCFNNICRAPSCFDEVLNGLESDIDCGGPCSPCDVGQHCVLDEECQSLLCDELRCAASSCEDAVVNGAETDVDCGGDCAPCTAERRCISGGDCDSQICQNQRCLPPRCGDGFVNGDEVCDDENLIDDDDCTNACRPALCGDDIVHIHRGEVCDTGGESALCDDDCTLVECGDSRVNLAAGEECDDGERSAECDEDCTFAICGDQLVNALAGEACDGGARCDDQCRVIPIPVVSLEVVDGDVFEGGVDTGLLRIRLSEAIVIPTEVQFTLIGPAQLDEDYSLSVNGAVVRDSLMIEAGQDQVDLVVTPMVTTAVERTEWFEITITPADDIYTRDPISTARINVYEYGPSLGATYYVDPGGDDDALGTEDAPFATLNHALSVMQPGDMLYLFDGIYTNADYTDDHGLNGDEQNDHRVLAQLNISGDDDHWTTIAAYPDGDDERPILMFDGAGGLQIQGGSSHIVIDGLEIYGPNEHIRYEWAHEHRWTKESLYAGRGIYTWGPVDHIVVRNCDIHHTPNSGIRFNKADYILVEHNTVSNTTWWSSSAESGIVIATAEHIDTADDVKILYSGNVVYNNWNFMEFCSGPLGPVGGHEGSDEDVYGNCDVYTGGIIDGQGLYVTRNNLTYLHGRMRFENNIAFNNGFGGVVYHKTNRGELVNNLVFMNGAYPGLSNYTGMTLNTAQDVLISNNIIWARDGDDYALKNNGNARDVVVTHNLVIGRSQFGSDVDNSLISFTEAPLLTDLFTHAVDISAFAPDPHLDSGPNAPPEIDIQIRGLGLNFVPLSTAQFLIDLGTTTNAPPSDHSGVMRPQGDGIDIGPFEISQPVE